MSRRAQAEHFGRQAESRACRIVEAAGWEIIAKRLRTPYGEIDLLARKPEGGLPEKLAISGLSEKSGFRQAQEKISDTIKEEVCQKSTGSGFSDRAISPMLVLVEVKARRDLDTARAALSARQLRRLSDAALWLGSHSQWLESDMRIDLIAINATGSHAWIENVGM